LSRFALDFRRTEAGTCDLLWGENPLFETFHPVVLLEDGTELPEGVHDDLEVKLYSENMLLAGRNALLLTLELSRSGRDPGGNREPPPVKVAAFNLLPGVPAGGLAPSPHVFRNGWQSWSFSGAWPLEKPDPDSSSPETQTGHGKPGRPVPPPGGAVSSDWVTVIGGGGTAGRPWLVLGFITGRRQFGEFELAATGEAGLGPASSGDERGPAASTDPGREGRLTRLTARSLAEGVPLAPGETLRSETLAVAAGEGDPWPVLEALAEETGRRAWSEAGRPEGPPRTAPTGWCTWYHYFDGITEPGAKPAGPKGPPARPPRGGAPGTTTSTASPRTSCWPNSGAWPGSATACP